MIQIRFPGLTMYGGLVHPLRGFIVKEGGLSGLEDLPDGDSESSARPQGHGSFDLPVFRRVRLVSISGWAFASSGFELSHLRDQLVGLGADGGLVAFSFHDEGGVRAGSGRVNSCKMPQHGRDHPVKWSPFALSLECRDPKLYGDRHVFTGASVEAHHLGNLPAAPVVEVAGPRSGPYTITGPGGRKVTVSQSLTAGQTHRIDFATGGVTRNGSRQLGALTHFTPWSVPPGTIVPMSISAGSMTVFVADTYM